ncbi:transglutaminase domain-containing protein [Candidatus Thorarchaeota archaeon]|nr:MAG: transglutaminase domain-containing protein [Candidatus Thorarchaeota archaeon]
MRLKIEMQANIKNLGNSKLRHGIMTWHLFTDMDNQFVEMIDVFPPARVTERAEKNMIAIIKIPELNPGESFSPTVILRIDTTTRDWLMEPQETPDQMMARNRGMYCTMQKYWETQDDIIQEITKKSAERSGDDESFARLVFSTVRESVKLKTHLDERRGAARAIREREGDCDEHADLFIAMLRAMKIPARRIVGHYYRGEEKHEAHAWCEVYLEQKGWIPVDPALGNFGIMSENYFSRIREGLISERPTLKLKWSGIASEPPAVEEEVKMSVLENGNYQRSSR